MLTRNIPCLLSRALLAVAVLLLIVSLGQSARATSESQTKFKRIPTQFIAALGGQGRKWTAGLRPGDTIELQAGMCFHFQSGMWLDDFGAAISEPFVVTENGGERLSNVARELIVID